VAHRICLGVVTAAVAVMLAGCGPTSPPATAPTGSGPGGVLGTVPAASGSPGAGGSAAPVLPDGRSPILVTTVDAGAHTLTFDLVELYLGADARTQWLKDHPGATEVPPLNGHYLRNNNPRLRTLPVAADVVVHVIPGGDPTHPDTISYAAFATYPELNAPYWITVTAGVVTLIEQQYIP
jgi:hypothetical protein